ncbi:uncharacterized protein N7500_000552 [Penicillium coprophilum]|uniref:uncharacterized protein n=1 Tax=Penicillium coprophilum TaxID=36646 RepID=UPI0023A2FA2D|nr:uncharacterized protein N7500_000552 [Penicillium coprophilum]KAJ5177853.1 hypothetical protein N7500_000552 [Penicillium coprophilum]
MNAVLNRPFSEGKIKLPEPGPSSHYRPHNSGTLDPFSPVNENGSFEFDRVLKTGKVSRRVKHKHVFRASWKAAYLVLRPNLLSVYKDEETTRLRVSISLSEVTAVAPVKSPRSTRRHVFGVFTPSTNYRFEALTEHDAEDWIARIRAETPGDEDEQAFLALTQRPQPPAIHKQLVDETTEPSDFDHIGRASSPSHTVHCLHAAKMPRDSLTSKITRFSDGPAPARDSRLRSMRSLHSLSVPAEDKQVSRPSTSLPRDANKSSDLGIRRDPERVICQGYLQGLRIQGTVRQWKRLWVVLRPKSLAFYKNESEYAAIKIIPMSQVFDAAEVDPLSRSKTFCMQIIAEEKTYRLCAPEEESLARWLGSLKSILAARRRLDPAPGTSVS